MISRLCLVGLLSALVCLAGCQKPVPRLAEPHYNQALPAGAFGLRRITDPARRPDLQPAVDQLQNPAFVQAMTRSLQWFAYPSTKSFFPTGPISHVHAQTSVYALSQIRSREQLEREFDIWESVGWDGRGSVLYTAYYTPTFRASPTRTGRYRYPLYKRPADLRTDPATGQVVGSYPTRSQLEQSSQLRGRELVYLPSRLDAYIIEVNGSAQLTFPDGQTRYVGYAGTNGHDYTSLGRELVREGKLPDTGATLPAIERYFDQHPDELEAYIARNDRMVFFQFYDGTNWPAGSLGFQVTPLRSLATDKAIFPRGCAVLVDTTSPDGSQPLTQLMLDQDTGGAIRAAGRADIYAGIGARAALQAGQQKTVGRLYYLLLKPDRVQHWYNQMVAR